MQKSKRVGEKKLSIINRSLWADEFVNPVCQWIVDRAGITWSYEIVLRRGIVWHGTGGKRRQNSTIPRHYLRKTEMRYAGQDHTLVGRKPLWPHAITDRRYKYAIPHLVNNRVESFVYLIAHEACHANEGHPEHFKSKGGRTNTAYMEYKCNDFAMKTVEAFREVWKTSMKKQVQDAIRKYRNQRQNLKDKKIAIRMKKNSTEFKLEKAKTMLDLWQRKLKAATNKVRKYQRIVKRCEKRLDHPVVKKEPKLINPLIMYKKPIGPKLPRHGQLMKNKWGDSIGMYLPNEEGKMLFCKISSGDVDAPNGYRFAESETHFIHDVKYARSQTLEKCSPDCDCQPQEAKAAKS